jgi:hypothetical protein
MRVVGLALAGVLAVCATAAAYAVPPGSEIRSAKTAVVQVWGGCGWGWHLVPGHWSRWRGGWVPPHCAPNLYPWGWGPYDRWAYGGWGSRYGPYDDWGALWYPYRGWRGPSRGWGNP